LLPLLFEVMLTGEVALATRIGCHDRDRGTDRWEPSSFSADFITLSTTASPTRCSSAAASSRRYPDTSRIYGLAKGPPMVLEDDAEAE
jgi:hypothetical protein